MPRLLGLGLLAAGLFSITFVVNRSMSLGGGHWAWSASLRYFDAAAMLMLFLAARSGIAYLIGILELFRRQLGFWLVAGGIGCGVFYSTICYAAGHAPGWIIAATWQLTILATPVVLRMFGARVQLRGVAFLALIFLGTLVLNAERVADGVELTQVLQGTLPVLVAAFAYPIGNQMVNRARHSDGATAAALADPAAAVLLLTLGALPLFAALVLLAAPPWPSPGQLVGTGIIALVAGGVATTLFLYARNLSSDPWRIAAVDATQSGEVAFALAGEMLLLGAASPDLVSCLGLLAVTGGLAGFAVQTRPRDG